MSKTQAPDPAQAPRPFDAVKSFADGVLKMLDKRIEVADRASHPFNDYFGDKPEAIVAAKAQASELREVRTQVRILGDRALVDLMKFKPAIPAPEGALRNIAETCEWNAAAPGTDDEKARWARVAAFARAALAAQSGDELQEWSGATPFLRHVQSAAGIDRPDWGDEFLAWYKPGDWLGEHRGAAVWLGQRIGLLNDVAETLRGQLADLQALCDERGRKLYGEDGEAPAEAHGTFQAWTKVEECIGAYWDAAYQEGKDARDHDDVDGTAQCALTELRKAVGEYAVAVIASKAQPKSTGEWIDPKHYAEDPSPAPAPQGGVDCIGLALDLEARAKTVESQTTERAMSAAAHGLRLLASAQAPAVAHEKTFDEIAATERANRLGAMGSAIRPREDEDARDAARYRVLRDKQYSFGPRITDPANAWLTYTPEGLDQACDDMLTFEAGSKPPVQGSGS